MPAVLDRSKTLDARLQVEAVLFPENRLNLLICLASGRIRRRPWSGLLAPDYLCQLVEASGKRPVHSTSLGRQSNMLAIQSP